jgi:hypothetical protein
MGNIVDSYPLAELEADRDSAYANVDLEAGVPPPE